MRNLSSPPGFVPGSSFEEYSRKYAEHCVMERRDGAIMLRFHSEGKAIVWSPQMHRAIGQAVREAGADPENEVMIITGTGDFWIAYSANEEDLDDGEFKGEAGPEERALMSAKIFMGDGMDMIRALVYDVQIPMIGAINGPGFHMEIPLFCDVTITSDRTVMVDSHRWMGFVPGDGLNVVYEGLMGNKRANYAMLTTQAIDARTALEYGMVNEVVPHDELQERAWQLAAKILEGGPSRSVERRMTTAIMRKHWLTRLSQDFFGGFAAESFAYMVTPAANHGEDRVHSLWEQAGVEVPRERR